MNLKELIKNKLLKKENQKDISTEVSKESPKSKKEVPMCNNVSKIRILVMSFEFSLKYFNTCDMTISKK